MRRSTVTAVLAVGLVLAGCSSDESESEVPTRLLQATDLPDTPSESEPTDRIAPLGFWCGFEFGGILGPSWDIAGVDYSGVDGARVISLLSRHDEVTDEEDRITAMQREFDGCAALATEEQQIDVLDLGPGRSGYAAPAYSQAPAGEVGFAATKDGIVAVAVVGDGVTSFDLNELLDSAVQRADDAD